MKEAELKQTQTNTQIQQLNQKQTLLDQERQRLQTQLNAYSNELSNVEKAEESAIKNSTPKFSYATKILNSLNSLNALKWFKNL